MDLFETAEQRLHNHLPYDGCVLYYGSIMNTAQADICLHALMQEADWQHDQAHIHGKKITTKRKMAWQGDRAYAYHYSNVCRVASPWTVTVKQLKQQVEEISGEFFNACLMNLYHHGEEGMAWHRDAERELKAGAAIASLSLGAQRKFSFKHQRSKERIDLYLEHGSLLIMKDETQQHWLHQLPTSKSVQQARINLTFRQMLE